MKTIKNIDEKLMYFQDIDDPLIQAQLPTYRRMMKSAVAMAVAPGEQAIDLYQLGLKFSWSEGHNGADLKLEDAEFKLLQEVVGKNPAAWMSHYLAQVMIRLRESAKAD